MNRLQNAESMAQRRTGEAIRWFMQMHYRALPPDQIDEWSRWDQDPANRAEYDRISHIWSAADGITVADIPAPTAHASPPYDPSESIASWQARRQALAALAQDPLDASRQPRRRFRYFAIAATLLCSLLAGMYALNYQSTLPEAHASVFETVVGEHREIELQDGSKIELGGKSSVSVSMSGDFRTVFLNSGEALFTVAHDPTRPFNVVAGSGTITAVGTAFNVRRSENNRVVVTVTEGVVQVTPNRSTTRRDTTRAAHVMDLPVVTRVQHGEQITYDNSVQFINAQHTVDKSTSLAWRDGRLQYDAEPLRSVLADVNRYSPRQLKLGDTAAGALPYTGTVIEQNVDEWIGHLTTIYPTLEVTTTDVDTVVIRTRPLTTNR